MKNIKKCCFNCCNCYSAPDNEFDCRVDGVIRGTMDYAEVIDAWCGLFEKDNKLSHPIKL